MERSEEDSSDLSFSDVEITAVDNFEDVLIDAEILDLNEKIEHAEFSLKNLYEQKKGIDGLILEKQKKVNIVLADLSACGHKKTAKAKARKNNLQNTLKSIRSLLTNYTSQSDQLKLEIDNGEKQISNLKDKKAAIAERIKYNI